MEFHEIIDSKIESLKEELDINSISQGEILCYNGYCQILAQSAKKVILTVETEIDDENVEYTLSLDNNSIYPIVNDKNIEWDHISFACLLQVRDELKILAGGKLPEYKKYTRKGMVNRVVSERAKKAAKANYHIKWAGNIYGDHILTNEKGSQYKVFLRDFDNEIGYSDSMDAKFNKLGTTKHIMFVFNKLKEGENLFNRLSKKCPFVEIFCDPLNDYKVSWFYPHKLPLKENLLISKLFKGGKFIDDNKILELFEVSKEFEADSLFRIRPEVYEKMEKLFEDRMLESVRTKTTYEYSLIKATLFDYQKEGVAFALYKSGAIIADEMGLGKTIQAITLAVLKKEIFDFKKTLVVCPASLKEQWKNEIEKFSNEKAIIVAGLPVDRAGQYASEDHYFFIVNYETVLRDQMEINKHDFDFLILDEAQRVKNYATKTAHAIKNLMAKHKLIITGTPIENRLIEIFSLMAIIDPYFLGPLWEFSYQHCYFDPEKRDKINGYFNLQELNQKLSKVLLRREKRKVLDQLPGIQQIDIPVELSPLQADYHANYAAGLSRILNKKFLTPFDLQRLVMLLNMMRMVCDSTYLVDEETNESPKLEELKHLLLEKLDVRNSDRKIIIFSEWIKVHKLIGRMLRENGIGFVELNGRVPVKARGELIRKFEDNPEFKVFLSTESGGSGLNLQVADTLINFELPWNPAKKNQRIGRIDRIGQKSKNLTVVNFVTKDSVEVKIAQGLIVKQSLFDGVLGDNGLDEVDFTTKGRSQFILQLEEMIDDLENDGNQENIDESEDKRQKEVSLEEIPKSENLDHDDEYDEDEIDIDDFEGKEDEKDNIEIESEKVAVAVNEEKLAQESETARNVEQMEDVLNSGMQFLSGMFKMATGKDMGTGDQKIEVDKETGEVVMRFKLPM